MTSTRQMAARALAVGLIGYAAVVFFYAAVDLLAGRSILDTGMLLGMAFSGQLHYPEAVGLPLTIDLEALFRHNLMHLCVSVTIGFIVIGLVEDAVRSPWKSRFILFTFFLGFIVTVSAMTVLTDPIRPFLPVWSIVVSNAVAAAIAAVAILHWYPGLWTTLAGSAVRKEG